MKNFWESAKKQYVLGVDSVKKMAGVKTEPEDSNYLDNWEKLQNIEISTINIYKSLSDVMNSSQKLCDTAVLTSTTISSNFDTNDAPFFQNSQQTLSYLTDCRDFCKEKVWADLNEKCLGPLRDYLQKITDLKKIAEKRKKNKILCQSATEPQEIAKRQEKYARYNTSYFEGVSALASRQTQLYVEVFNQHQYCLANFIDHAKQGSAVLTQNQ